jgi:glycosyltransferase involved in cell wall biosynthesis
MRLINLVDRLDRVNFGIWNAAISTASELLDQHGMVSEIWYPEQTREAEEADLNGAIPRGLEDLGADGFRRAVAAAGLNPETDLIISHGCWQYPSRWGHRLKKMGFAWVAVPHGMLESWSVSQKRLRKAVYYRLVERPALKQADRIRAVGKPEYARLREQFADRTVWIPNGVRSLPDLNRSGDVSEKRVFLFMARLHHKKGIMALLEAWKTSSLSADPACQLKIAGPDDGQLAAVQAFLGKHDRIRNIAYLGAVYGREKEALLKDSHFYVLPSHSEGFPTSVLEGMQYGLVPIISPGCNFPDVFEHQLGFRVEPEVQSIRVALERAQEMEAAEIRELSQKARLFIEMHYTHSTIAQQQADLYAVLLNYHEKRGIQE